MAQPTLSDIEEKYTLQFKIFKIVPWNNHRPSFLDVVLLKRNPHRRMSFNDKRNKNWRVGIPTGEGEIYWLTLLTEYLFTFTLLTCFIFTSQS